MTLLPGILRQPADEKGKPEGFVVTDITPKPRVASRSSISMAAGQWVNRALHRVRKPENAVSTKIR
jgi:hypothetical protein